MPSLRLCLVVVAAVALAATSAVAVTMQAPPSSLGAAPDTPELQPPIEVEGVWGCADDTTPRATTAGCIEGDSITIRGRYFGRSGAKVSLIPERPGFPAAMSGADAVECHGTRHSTLLPTVLLYCVLPAKPTDIAAGVDASGNALPVPSAFHLRVAARNGITAVKRGAISFSSGEADEAEGGGEAGNEGGGARRSTDASLRLLDPARWSELGIGGLGPQFKDLFRRAFGSRLGLVAPVVAKSGMRHVKGVIFHGLPGTGKTLVARKVAEALGSKNVRIVNGPEIMSKFVGDSERNLRELFGDADEAWEKHGAKSPLYVIVIDEMDAIMRSRGTSRSDDSAARAVYDGVTTQMLAYMDGMKTGDNLLIIGLTNRLDALDPALLRPGRFEVQIRFPLPDRDGRKQILSIHTRKLIENNFLADDVSVDAIVDATASFSGADLAATVRSATSYAMARVYENAPAPGSDAAKAMEDSDVTVQFKVKNADLRRGMREVLAAKTASSNTEPYLKHGLVNFHERVADTLKRLGKFAADVKTGASQNMVKVLLEGPSESGLTALAAAAARLAQFPHVHVVSPDAMVGLTPEEKVERLRQAFDAAVQAPAACIVLDSIEHLLEYNAASGGSGRGSALLQYELSGLLRRRIQASTRQGGSTGAGLPKGAADELDGRVMVIATSSVPEAVRTLSGGMPLFDAVEVVQPMSRADTAMLLGAYGVAGTAAELTRLAAQLPPSVPVKRMVFFLSVAHARHFGSSHALRPVSEHQATLDVFADAAASDNSDEGDAKGKHRTKDAAGPLPIETVKEVLTEFGVLEDYVASDRLQERIQW